MIKLYIALVLIFGLLLISGQQPPQTVYQITTTQTGVFFSQFSLTNQKTTGNASIQGFNNCVIYGIIDYDESLDSLLLLWYNASEETDNIGYYSTSKNQMNPNPLYSIPNGQVEGYFLTLTPIAYDSVNHIVYLSILDFEDSNLTIYKMDFENSQESRIQFDELIVRQRFYTPSGLFLQRGEFYYTFYVGLESNLPTVLVWWTQYGGNSSTYEFSNWNIEPQSSVYLLHTENYAEGRLFALVFSESTVTLYKLYLFSNEAEVALTLNVVPGSTSLSNGIQFVTSASDYVVIQTNSSPNKYTFTTVNLGTLETSSFTTSNSLMLPSWLTFAV